MPRKREKCTMTRSEIAKEIWARPGFKEKRIGFRHTPESIEKMRVIHTGMKHVTDEGKARLSKAKKGVKRSPEIAEMLKTINIGRHPSEEALKKMSECRKGKNLGSDNPYWRGGLTPLSKRIRASFEYRQWRSDIFTRDNFTCVTCDRKENIEVHHSPDGFMDIFRRNNIKNLEDGVKCEEFWNINNGITLCKQCHKIITVHDSKHRIKFNA